MTVFYGTQMTKFDSVPATPSPGFTHGTVRCFAETVTFNSQATTDTIEVGFLPKGSVFLYGILNNDTSSGSATIAIGITGTTGKFRAALAKTTAVPEVFGVTAAQNVALAADATVIVTIAAASLPSSGTMTITMVYATN